VGASGTMQALQFSARAAASAIHLIMKKWTLESS